MTRHTRRLGRIDDDHPLAGPWERFAVEFPFDQKPGRRSLLTGHDRGHQMIAQLARKAKLGDSQSVVPFTGHRESLASGGVAAGASPRAPYQRNEEGHDPGANPYAVNDGQDHNKEKRYDQDAAERR